MAGRIELTDEESNSARMLKSRQRLHPQKCGAPTAVCMALHGYAWCLEPKASLIGRRGHAPGLVGFAVTSRGHIKLK